MGGAFAARHVVVLFSYEEAIKEKKKGGFGAVKWKSSLLSTACLVKAWPTFWQT